MISGESIVWTGNDGNDTEIFLYNGSETVQLTDNDVGDFLPVTSGNNVVWERDDGNDREIFLYDGNETVQLTDNDVDDFSSLISEDRITWYQESTSESGEEVNTIFLATPNNVDSVSGTTVYRFFNNDTGVHFYTADETERDAVENLANFNPEGASYQGADPLTGGSTPVYRFLNEDTGVHLYTVSETERATTEDLSNFSFEGEAFFAYDTQVDGSIPVYRFFNSTTGAHFYTPSEGERDDVEDNLPEFESEGIAYYALPSDF